MVRQPRVEERRELIAAWESSGESRRAWCAEYAVKRGSMRRWNKRLRSTATEARVVEVQGPQQPWERITMLRPP